jgi:hypothetical protein
MKSKEGTVDQIRESLDKISELSDEELDALESSVVSEFKTVQSQDPTREVVTQMIQLADAADALRGERSKREVESQELVKAAADAVARMEENESAETPEEGAAEGDAPAADDTADAETAETPDAAPAAEDAAEAAETPAPEATEASDEEPAEAAVTPVDEEAPADAPAETPEAPAEAPADAPVDQDAAGGGETTDDAGSEPDLSEEDKKKIASLSSDEEAELAVDAPEESEAAATEAPAEAEELSAEEAPADELSATTPTTTEAELASDETKKDSEEPVTASATPEGLEFQAPADRSPAIVSVKAPMTITAGADIKGIPMGSELPDIAAVASALLERKKSMGKTSGGDGEQSLVASFRTDFPEARFLNSSDFEGNRAKIDGVVSAEAITAAGGLTAPVETSYDIFELGETLDRPVKDALAVFGADRGGIRFMTPPLLTDLNGAVSLWTMQDDIDAATEGAPDPEKPCLRVAAGTEITVYVDAIPLCLTFGNLGARAFPELVERHTKLGMVLHARYAETRLLTRIGALSTPVTAASELGVARDIFGQIDRAAAAYRSRYRLDENAPLRVIFPSWFKNALRADLIKQLPGDGRDGTFNLAEGEINQWFSTRSINVSWHIDGETGQIFGTQDAGAELLKFPSDVIWYLFSEGTFLFLDAGTLDLGLVRDSTLNGTNDYKIFLETFEGVAKVGVESLRIKSALALKGSASATTAVAG